MSVSAGCRFGSDSQLLVIRDTDRLVKAKVTKEKQIEVEAFQNPWRLANFIDWSK